MQKTFVAVFLMFAGCGDDDDDDPIDDPVDGSTVYDIALTRDAEVPVCASAPVAAQGSVSVSVALDNSAVAVRGLSIVSLSGYVTAAHVHAGARGVAGPIVFPLSVAPVLDQVFTDADYPRPPPSGAPSGFTAFVEMIRTGGAYVNVHTIACPSGEIRGQIE